MDTMREALEAAVDEQEKADESEVVETTSVAEPAESVATEKVDSEPAGELAKKTEPADTPVQKAEIPPTKAEEPLAPGQHRVDRAPASWRKEAKGEWASVPLHIRQEVHRRELEINRALQESTQARQNYDQIQQVIAPFTARLNSLNATPVQAIDTLLRADYTLATAPKEQRAQFMAKLIRDYDIDIVALDAAIVGGQQGQYQPQQQPDITQLIQQQLQQALAPIYQERQQAQQTQQQQAIQTVEQMALDPKYPYLDEVREEMADLIEVSSRRGIYLSLDQAYSKAIQLNPDVSAQVQRQATMTQANQQHLQAQKAKVAASSVTGAPAGGGSQQHVGDGSLRGDLEAALANMRI